MLFDSVDPLERNSKPSGCHMEWNIQRRLEMVDSPQSRQKESVGQKEMEHSSLSCREIPVSGTWKRLHAEDPLGDLARADRTTLVLWTQARDSGVFIDIRLPKASPGRSREAAEEAGFLPRPSALAAVGFEGPAKAILIKYVSVLTQQKSFAGSLKFRDGDHTKGEAFARDMALRKFSEAGKAPFPKSIPLSTCTWNRDIDYQPPTGFHDRRVCASQKRNADGSILLRGTANDASYAESWLCLPRTYRGPFLAMELVSENGIEGARHGYWVRTGNKFTYAIGRPNTPEYAQALHCLPDSALLKGFIGKDLLSAVTQLSKNQYEILDLIGSYVALAGDIVDEDNWVIKASTNPELVGCTLVGGDAMSCSRLMPHQSRGESRISGQAGGETSSSENQEHSDSPDLVQQIIDREGCLSVTRAWRILEQTGCSLPFHSE